MLVRSFAVVLIALGLTFSATAQTLTPPTLLSPADSITIGYRGRVHYDWTNVAGNGGPVTYDLYLFNDIPDPNWPDTMVSGLAASEILIDPGDRLRWFIVVQDTLGDSAVSDTNTYIRGSCCYESTGDVNADLAGPNLIEVTLLVNWLFVTFVPVDCFPEANLDGDPNCTISLTDLTELVNLIFVTFEPVAWCNDFDNALCDQPAVD